jgi:N-methylhydantoinase A
MSPARSGTNFRIAIDTGGTFTDCVWVERGRVRMLKVFSTPADPSEAIAEALRKIGAPDSLIILHGTTVGTNTLLQRKGARVALVTTAGFEDAIEIGRQARPKLYDFLFDRVEPLVASELRFGVEERTASDGKILLAASPKELAGLLTKLRGAQPESIAISLLFTFANPQNESAVAQACRSLALPISVSHEILPEFREYERTSTVMMNAYLQPVVQKYLENLARRAHSSRGKSSIFVMQSSGGITALSSAAREPMRTVLSGPAGGVVGAAAMARRSGFDRIISFDMGGTSTDVALVDQEIRTGSQAEIAGLPVGVPMLDIHTVGAGGGSIARFDAAGALRVGPESAGADPGPICYGRGTQPTVTDANLLLGRLQPNAFLGGEFTLDLGRTRRMISDWLKKQSCSLTLLEFAAGVVRVVNANMEKALRVVSIERGYDPRDFTLVAFGGAGGLHACELAEALGIPRVIVPALPGALSAFGILVSDVVKDYSRTVLWRIAGKLPAEQCEREFAILRLNAKKGFREEGWRGAINFHRSVDVRYRGQGYELNAPYSSTLIEDFRREHQRRYGYCYDNRELELVTLRLRAKIRTSQVISPGSAPKAPAAQKQKSKKARVLFGGKKFDTSLYDRDVMSIGKRHSGPAIVAEYSATTVVPPGKPFWLDRAGNLMIAVR